MKRFLVDIINKLNPAQPEIVEDFGQQHAPSVNLRTNQAAYNVLEIVNRGVNLIVDSAAGVPLDVGDILEFSDTSTRIRKKRLNQLLNFRPNNFYNADVFKRNIFLDLILEGDAFLYYDGVHLYNLPATSVNTIADEKFFIKHYEYKEKVFKPNEIIHIKENASDSIFTGTSRLDSAKASLNLLVSMNSFQTNFFENSAIPGIILTTPNPLSERVKNRLVQQWSSKYNPKRGGKRPLILDGEFKVESLSKYNFKELDFNESIALQETKVLKALGVPPVLLNSGNNANINPNMRMFFIQTVIPLVNKLTQALEMQFGYDIKPITQNVHALRPELQDQANFLSSLVNSGILTRNEAREELRKHPKTGNEDPDNIADNLILPANVAGSAQDAGQGGRPEEDKDELEDNK